MRITELILDGFKSYPVRTSIAGWDPSFNAITGLYVQAYFHYAPQCWRGENAEERLLLAQERFRQIQHSRLDMLRARYHQPLDRECLRRQLVRHLDRPEES